MSYTVKTFYDNGYVVEEVPNGKLPCESWILLPAENLWPDALKGILYIVALFYFFVGIAIASDIFMSSIEVITSKKRKVVKWDSTKGEKVEMEVLIWNETVANLTLMALGSSAPEILLAVIETISNLSNSNDVKDSLGTFTIIGSAAFNLLIITAICIVSVPKPQAKSILEFGVFMVTAVWSILAYVWMLLVVKYISPGEIEPWEAWCTLGCMPLFVFVAYCTDNGWWCRKQKVEDGEEEHIRVLNQRGRAGSFTGHIVPGKELNVLEAERRAHNVSIISLSSVDRKDKDSVRSIPLREFLVHSTKYGERTMSSLDGSASFRHPSPGFQNHRDGDETTVEIESPAEKVTNVNRTENVSLSRARFRHLVVSAMTGGAARTRAKSNMADVVAAASKLEKARREGKVPQGDLLGKFTFASDRYAVLESAGVLELEVLFHRNLPGKGVIPFQAYNGDSPSVAFENGNTTIQMGTKDTIQGTVSVWFETREGSAKFGKDMKYKTEELVFKDNEYKKTISIPIINDNQFENDVDFYIILKNPRGGSGLGDPSVARVTIVDDDEPGEFQFEQDHCMADLSAGKVATHVIREHGHDGHVTMEYATIDGTAVGGQELNSKTDYISQQGKLEFNHAETSKLVTIDINKEATGPKNFIITLKNPSLGAKIGTRSAIVCNITKDDLGDRLAGVVSNEQEETTWGQQFVSAMSIGGSEDEDGNEIPATWFDYLMHFLTFFWKILGACVPPTQYWSAWPTFVFSLVYIGMLTAVVEQLGHLMGCVIGLRTSVTGVTFIALGTSLPDTFASRTAAKQDQHADAAIGNVTGSNSVNVFLGLGLPWVISTMYHLSKGTTFKVASGNLTQSVIIFSCIGTVCILFLILRRKFVGGELGGKNSFVRIGSMFFLLSLWVIYIVLVSLKAYDILKWEI